PKPWSAPDLGRRTTTLPRGDRPTSPCPHPDASLRAATTHRVRRHPHANCMFMQHHAYFFLCPRYSPLCPSVKVSASPSPEVSTPLSRSHGCARRAPCHAPTPPTSASTTNPTS